MKQYAALDDTVYFWFAGNDTSGSGGDGASPAADVRLAGAAAGAAPVYSPTPALLSHANYPAGAYEIAIAATAANGFAATNTYAVFCTLAIDSQNPTGFVGSFDLKPVESNPTQLGDSAQSLTDLKDFADAGYDPATNKVQGVVLADTVTTLTGHTAQTGDSFARLGAPAGASIAADLVTIDGVADGIQTDLDNATDGLGALKALIDTIDGIVDSILVDTGTTLDGKITTVDTVVDGIQTDLSNATDGLGALKALIDTVDGIVDSILADTGTDGVVVASGSKTGYVLSSTGADLILKSSTFALAMADAIWDEILTGATHNVASSAGRRVWEIGAYAIESGTSQAGNSHSITLAATASADDGIYNRSLIVLTDNTGVGQTRTIVDYNGTTKVAVIDRDWRVSPDATTAYQITADNTPLVVDQGVAQAGTATTITLRAYASSTNDIYLCNVVAIIAGTGRGQARLVGSYNGTTKVVTICGDNWTTTPDTTSIYVLMPYGTTCTSCMGTYALGQINTEVVDVMKTDVISEPAQGAPPATPTFEEAMAYLYFKLRNKTETTATEDALYDNVGTTKLIKSTISDDATTFTKGEYGTGA